MKQERILPQHIGLIMDGNGRWAKKRGLPRQAGHKVGASTFQKIVRYCNKIGIRYLTVYAFSTENWKRPAEEVEAIMNLLRSFLKDAKNHRAENVKTHFIGDRSMLAPDLQELMADCEKESESFTGLTLNIAVNYGGRDEIVHAAKQFAKDAAAGNISPDALDETLFSSYLYTKDQPNIGLIIRPSGEMRLSNFLLWQAAYAEYVFMDVLWPDFNEKYLEQALSEFANRNRRFGGV